MGFTELLQYFTGLKFSQGSALYVLQHFAGSSFKATDAKRKVLAVCKFHCPRRKH
jgi:hypothetical protein